MIRLPPFEVIAPSSLKELSVTLGDTNGDAKVLAGGTDLIVNIKQGVSVPKRVIWLGKVNELRRITFLPEEGLRIGAMCSLAEIASSPEVLTWYHSVSDVMLTIASPAVRNRATLGGNLCLDTRCYYYDQSEFWRAAVGGCLKLNTPVCANSDTCHAAPGWKKCSAISCSDTAPLLIALGASVRIIGSQNDNTLPLSQFYVADGIHHLNLRRDEVLAEVILPRPHPHQRSAHRKIRSRQAIDFPLASVGISLVLEADFLCRDARIIIGAIHTAPVEALAAETVLRGKELTDKNIELAAEESTSTVKPIPNAGETVGYRKRMVGLLVQRTLRELRSDHAQQ